MQRDKRFHHTNPYDRQYTRQTTKYATSVIIWGCISAQGSGRIGICDGMMDSAKYIKLPDLTSFVSAL